MQFSKIGEHTIRCVISEEEIQDLGYTVDEIMSNGERTQEFMNEIFDLAEQRFETKFDLGIKTVRADFMSDRSLALTFSEHPVSGDMMEHLRDIISGLIGSIPQQRWKELAGSAQDADETTPGYGVYATMAFSDLDDAIRYAKMITTEHIPAATLYKYEGQYMLLLSFLGVEEAEMRVLSNLTDEYAWEYEIGAERKAYIEEHGDCILKEHAIEQLKQL